MQFLTRHCIYNHGQPLTEENVGDGDERFDGRRSHQHGHDPGHFLNDKHHQPGMIQHGHERGKKDDDRQNAKGENKGQIQGKDEVDSGVGVVQKRLHLTAQILENAETEFRLENKNRRQRLETEPANHGPPLDARRVHGEDEEENNENDETQTGSERFRVTPNVADDENDDDDEGDDEEREEEAEETKTIGRDGPEMARKRLKW